MRAVSKEDAKKIAVDFLRRQKSAEKIDVSYIEHRDSLWIIQGTCPIDMEGHPWTERFEVIVDQKGNIRSSCFSLL